MQIVLITFMILVSSLMIQTIKVKTYSTNYQFVSQMMMQKNLEIMLTKYYLDTMENDILFSDYYEDETYYISSTVDDFGDYLEIVTEIRSNRFHYSFLLQIKFENLKVIKFE